MAFQIKEYDADQIVILIAGIALSQGAGQSGYADGEFLSVGFKPQFILVKGTDGSAARSKTNDRETEIKVNLLQTNSANAALSALLFADVSTPNGTGIGSFVVKDLQGTTLVSVPTAWITQPADITLDRGAKGRSWLVTGLWDVALIGGN
jgi:hypothetical protein